MQFGIEKLREGRVISVPTDTVPGLAIDPHSKLAKEALYALKGRDGNKPLVSMVDSLEKVRQIAEIPAYVEAILEKHWPGNLTVVFNRKRDSNSQASLGRTIGVRIPNHKALLAFLKEWGGELGVTSANLSGEPELLSLDAIKTVFGERIAYYGYEIEELLKSFDSTMDFKPSGKPSTVIDVTGEKINILRQGECQIE